MISEGEGILGIKRLVEGTNTYNVTYYQSPVDTTLIVNPNEMEIELMIVESKKGNHVRNGTVQSNPHLI